MKSHFLTVVFSAIAVFAGGFAVGCWYGKSSVRPDVVWGWQDRAGPGIDIVPMVEIKSVLEPLDDAHFEGKNLGIVAITSHYWELEWSTANGGPHKLYVGDTVQYEGNPVGLTFRLIRYVPPKHPTKGGKP